jgi:hypothetical protein
MIVKAWRIVQESGASALLRRAIAFAYRRGIRPWLPHSELVAYASLPIALYHKWGDRVVPASWLPSAIADIEGYEDSLVSGLRRYVMPGDRIVQILREMTIRPRVFLVETYGPYSAPTALVTTILEEMQYLTQIIGIADTRHAAFCEANDIYVVAALRADVLQTP